MAAQLNPIWNEIANMNPLKGQHSFSAQTTGGLQGRAMGATAGTNSSNGDVSANVSANDFLTLLVTEMKNQDPTANTDPNEYINQLVQVNSLEQLISINQTLTADSSSTPSGKVVNAVGSQPHLTSSPPQEAGNLSAPASRPASQVVAESLAQANAR